MKELSQTMDTIKRLLEEKPDLFSREVFGGDWQCPYCGAAGAEDVTDENRLARMEAHLSTCRRADRLQGALLEPAELDRIAERQRFARGLLDADRPLPAGPGGERTHETSRYQKQVEHLKQMVEMHAVLRYGDVRGHWVCPFCEMSIEHIDADTPNLAERVAAHLLSVACMAATRQFKVRKSPEDMAALVEDLNEQIRLGRKIESKPPSEQLRAQRKQRRRRKLSAEEMSEERRAAAAAQARMLPTACPQVEGYDVAFMFQPTQDISGDFFDVQKLGERRLAVGLGDVSGHGLASGLVMSMARSMLTIHAATGEGPGEVLARLNRDIFPALGKDMFISALQGLLDAETHTFTYARAGHNPPILVARASPPRELPGKGVSLGVVQELRFSQALEARETEIPPGGICLIYTDGLVEAMSPLDEEFGLERLMFTLNAVRDAGSARAFLDNILAAVQTFVQQRGFEDDIAMIAIRRESG